MGKRAGCGRGLGLAVTRGEPVRRAEPLFSNGAPSVIALRGFTRDDVQTRTLGLAVEHALDVGGEPITDLYQRLLHIADRMVQLVVEADAA